jgi:hypothetical protein
MKLPATVVYYRVAAIGCTIIIGCLLLLPKQLAFSALSLLPSEVVRGTWQVMKWLGLHSHLEYITHISAYAALMILALLSWQNRVSAIAIGIGIFMCGVTVELLQIPLPGHSFQVGDMLANFIGIVCGWFTTMGLLKATRVIIA